MAMNSFKKMLMMANQIDDKPSLPSYLVRCEYLEATGTQYIDLGYPLGYENKVVVEVEPVKTSTWLFVFGSTPVTGKRFDLSINTSKYFDGADSASNIHHDYKYSIVFNKEGIVSDGTLYGWKVTPNNFDTEENVFLFATRKTSGDAAYLYQGKIYSCQIYENDVLIHDYIPCFNTELRRPCMYDTITGIELYNQGTGEFNYHIEGRPIPYLAFEALEDDLQVSITKSATQYSLDRVTWIDLPAEEMTPPIAKGEKVWFKANITPDGTSTGIGTFSCTKQCNLEGTPMSLLYGDRAGGVLSLPSKSYCFAYLFAYNDKIIRINNPMEFLPAIKLGLGNDYRGMFYDDILLTNMPYLPALNLTVRCYIYFCRGCTSLVEVFDFPKWTSLNTNCCYAMLPYTAIRKSPAITSTLSQKNCYGDIYNYCGNLEYITALFLDNPSNILSTTPWVSSVAPKGTIVLNKNIEWNPDDYRGINGIPEGWEVKYCDPDNIDDVRDYREIDKEW